MLARCVRTLYRHGRPRFIEGELCRIWDYVDWFGGYLVVGQQYKPLIIKPQRFNKHFELILY
jgi:hypothetical protein